MYKFGMMDLGWSSERTGKDMGDTTNYSCKV